MMLSWLPPVVIARSEVRCSVAKGHSPLSAAVTGWNKYPAAFLPRSFPVERYDYGDPKHHDNKGEGFEKVTIQSAIFQI